MVELARSGGEFAARLVTTSPDVTVSTNLGGWVNQVGVFGRTAHADIFRERRVPSMQKWALAPQGRHIELGIAENNLFLLLAALGLAEPQFGARLLPVGTLYDPFIARGLDALNYACYQDARFLLVATPSGPHLGARGRRASIDRPPLIGIGQPGLTYFEPAFVDELRAAMGWALRPYAAAGWRRGLSAAVHPRGRAAAARHERAVIFGRHRRRLLAQGAGARQRPRHRRHGRRRARGDRRDGAHRRVDGPRRPAGRHLARPAASRLARRGAAVAGRARSWRRSRATPRSSRCSTAIPLTLSWLGAVRGQRISSLGVESFGQSGDIPDLYRVYQLDADAIVAAARRALDESRF